MELLTVNSSQIGAVMNCIRMQNFMKIGSCELVML
jgi:hypothetical protein